MLSQEQALAEPAKTWQFLELWVDPVLFSPRILTLIGDRNGSCRIFKPDADNQLVVTHSFSLPLIHISNEIPKILH